LSGPSGKADLIGQFILMEWGMEKQLGFAQAEYGDKKKVTRRERFPGEMEQLVPWGSVGGFD
jgi:hypothetical protein